MQTLISGTEQALIMHAELALEQSHVMPLFHYLIISKLYTVNRIPICQTDSCHSFTN